MGFTALLDANVLYPETLRDVLLTLAEVGVFQLRWSSDILDEFQRNVGSRAKAADPATAQSGAAYVRRLMEDAFPEAAIDPTAYRPLIGSMTNDPSDRHVLAAAVAGRADVIVTSNLRDFPDSACEPFDVDVQSPDVFLTHQFGLAPEVVRRALTDLAAERRPPRNSLEGLLNVLERVTPDFCTAVRQYVAGVASITRDAITS